MTKRKSYGQFCGLARSLDRVGDRWTLLVVRELLLGPRTFRELQESLADISPSLLTKRISELIDDGLAERNNAPPRSKAVVYTLTEAGRELEPAILALIRWGSRWMATGPRNDRVDAQWAPLALRALLEGRPASAAAVHLDVAGTLVTVRSRNGRRVVTAGHDGQPAAAVSGPLEAVLGVASGLVDFDDAEVAVAGDRATARSMLTPDRDRRR